MAVRIKDAAVVEDLKESKLTGIGYKCPVIRNVSSISLKRQKQSAQRTFRERMASQVQD